MSYFTDFNKIDKRKYFYDDRAAESAVRYIETHCYHTKGSLRGTPLILEEWQKDKIVRPLFGWKEKKETIIKDKKGKVIRSLHRRKHQYTYIEIPKKSGKSTLMSAIIQLMLDIDDEPGAEIVGMAWGRDQAKIIYDMVENSIRASPRMSARSKFYSSSKVLMVDGGAKRYSIWSKETSTQDGQSPNVVVSDELHRHKNGELIDMAEKSMAARDNPMSLTITTAGDNLDGVGYQRRQAAEKVAKGLEKDESLLVCIYCADKTDDIYEEKTWRKAMPNLGVSVSIDFIRKQAIKAKESPAKENAFKRYYLNIWNNTRDVFISDRNWMKSKWKYDLTDLEGRTCYGGLDLASTSDLTALALVFPIEEDKYVALYRYWLPEEKGTQSVDETTNVNYPRWIRDGYIVETPGNVIDYDFITHEVRELARIYNIEAIAYDPYRSVQVVTDLQDDGFTMHEFRQGYKTMNYPTKELERVILSKKFNHLGHPVTQWCCSNTSITSDPAGNIKMVRDITKRSLKIDGMIASVMALGTALDKDLQSGGSYLTDSGGELFTL